MLWGEESPLTSTSVHCPLSIELSPLLNFSTTSPFLPRGAVTVSVCASYILALAIEGHPLLRCGGLIWKFGASFST